MNAIEKVSGPCVILAGAGTGKTYTMVEKVKHLVLNNIYPSNKIACITFSNEAANNLLLRIDKSLMDAGIKKHGIIVRTFHGFSADLLRKYGHLINISKEFKILDPEQAMIILHRSLRINGINCKRYISTLSTAKDLGIKIEEFQKYIEETLKEYPGVDLEKRLENLNFELQTMHLQKEVKSKKMLISEVKKIKKLLDIKKFVSAWSAYEKIKLKGNYQDYSDLNKNALELLQKNPEISQDFQYFIIDEFQDTNKLQLEFVTALAKDKNITIVGDMNQSIYRFRGAYKENISIFKEYFNINNNDVFNLSKSFRSPNTVLRTAHKLILNNYQNKEECFYVENAHQREGNSVEIFELKDAKEEARKVIEIIKSEIDSGTPAEEICIMFRTHQYNRVLKRALEQSGIQYYAISKSSLLKQKSVKTAIDYLSILNKLKKKEKGGEQQWWDLMYNLKFQQPDLIKIGKEIKSFSRSDKKELTLSEHFISSLEKLELTKDGKIASKTLTEKIKLMTQSTEKPISQLLQDIYQISGMISQEQKSRDEKEVFMNLSKFLDLAKTHEELYDADLDNFIYYLKILEELEINIEAPRLEESGVRLMTSHATKGLEYKIVILTNFAQGRFPIEHFINNTLIPTELLPELKNDLSGLSSEEKDEYVTQYEKHHQLLEERRLAYVSFTRAKEKLIITFAESYNNKKVIPSQFLNEISFKENKDISFSLDTEQKYHIPDLEIKPANEFTKVLNSANFEESLNQLTLNQEVKEEPHNKFSPSALLLFSDCQKEFEYKYVYNMPEKKSFSWEAMRLGSFVHLVLEKGVNAGIRSIDDYMQLAKQLILEEEWESVSLQEVEPLIKVFFERNKGKYSVKSKTEQYLPLKIADISFMGFADRIDFTDQGVEIIDYKTGKSAIAPKDRNWQLGFYALAAQNKYGQVKRVVLDMLKQDRPLEFEIDGKGNAVCISSSRMDGFNIYEIQEELISTAKAIQDAYKSGFKPCSIDKNCEFCNEYVYGV